MPSLLFRSHPQVEHQLQVEEVRRQPASWKGQTAPARD